LCNSQCSDPFTHLRRGALVYPLISSQSVFIVAPKTSAFDGCCAPNQMLDGETGSVWTYPFQSSCPSIDSRTFTLPLSAYGTVRSRAAVSIVAPKVADSISYLMRERACIISLIHSEKERAHEVRYPLAARRQGRGAGTGAEGRDQTENLKQKNIFETTKLVLQRMVPSPTSSTTSRTPILACLPDAPSFLSFLLLWSHQRPRIWRISTDMMSCDELFHA
jgi:hypothetical protein